MTVNYIYSPSVHGFFPIALQGIYEAAGSWPGDGVPVDDATYQQYVGAAPAGKTLSYSGGHFSYVDLPPPPSPPTPPPPTLQQQAAAAMYDTVIVTGAHSAINGTYSIDAGTQTLITGVAAAVAAGLGLPGGGATFNWPDAVGAAHQWDAASFTTFAQQVMNYVYNCAQVAQGHQFSLPSKTLTI